MIAFVCIRSEFAAVRTLLPLHDWVGAYTALARTRNVGEASIARLVSPTSRRGITEQGESSLPLQRPEWSLDGHPRPLLGVESTLQAASACRDEPVSCDIEEPLRPWSPKHAHIPAGKQPSPTTDSARAEFVGANRLFARLVLHQVRQHDRSADAAKQQIGSSHNPNPGLVSVPAPDARSSFPLRSERSVTAAAASPDPLSVPIETLFSELARRRLRRLAAEERP